MISLLATRALKTLNEAADLPIYEHLDIAVLHVRMRGIEAIAK